MSLWVAHGSMQPLTAWPSPAGLFTVPSLVLLSLQRQYPKNFLRSRRLMPSLWFVEEALTLPSTEIVSQAVRGRPTLPPPVLKAPV